MESELSQTEVTVLDDRAAVAAEWQKLLRLALPLVGSVACFAVTLYCDRLLLMWFDPAAAAAAMAAGSVYWAIACMPVSAMGYATPLIARHAGRCKSDPSASRKMVDVVVQTAWMSLAALPAFVAIGSFGEQAFAWAGHEGRLAEFEASYLGMLVLVGPASMLEAGLSAYLVARRETRPVFLGNLGAAALNLLLDAVLIFGLAGAPRMGILGAVTATLVAMWAKAAYYAWCLLRHPEFRHHLKDCYAPRVRSALKVLLPGLALGVQQTVRSFTMSTALLAIGAGSTIGLAASSAAFSTLQLVIIPLIGLSTATTVMVAEAMGHHGGRRAASGRWRRFATAPASGTMAGAFQIALSYVGCVSLVMLASPAAFLAIHFAGMEPSELRIIGPVADSVVRVLAVYAIADAAVLILTAALTAGGWVLASLVSNVLSAGLVLLCGYAFAPAGEGAVMFWWWLLTVWSVVHCVLLATFAFTMLSHIPTTRAA